MNANKLRQEKGQINILIKKDDKSLCCIIEDNGRGLQGAEFNNYQKRSLSTIISQERLQLLSRKTGSIAQLTIVDKKATVGEPGVRVELIIPYLIDDEAPNE